MTNTTEARGLLENPKNRLAHAGASLFVAGTDPKKWFADHPDCLDHARDIRRGYEAASILRAGGELFV
jgi:hypothetical protein